MKSPERRYEGNHAQEVSRWVGVSFRMGRRKLAKRKQSLEVQTSGCLEAYERETMIATRPTR